MSVVFNSSLVTNVWKKSNKLFVMLSIHSELSLSGDLGGS